MENRSSFGAARDGRLVERITLRRGGLEAEIITFGAALTALRVPAADGTPVDVVLGCTSVAAYEESTCYLGATVGRYANRIAGASFPLDGERVVLSPNEGSKQLHGGLHGFSYRIFAVDGLAEDWVRLTYRSAHGEEGYPGNLDVAVTYALTEAGLSIRYQAETDRPTVVNLTNHSYFNLNGGGDAMGHRLWIGADAFVPVGSDSLPIAREMAVEGTPFDFRREKAVGRDIGADHPQLRATAGYDHSYLIPGSGLRLAARLTGERSGIAMETWTDMPAVQLYTANFLYADRDTRSGSLYGRRQAVCLETQFPPDSPNHQDWWNPVLRPGEPYDRRTEYRFLRRTGEEGRT